MFYYSNFDQYMGALGRGLFPKFREKTWYFQKLEEKTHCKLNFRGKLRDFKDFSSVVDTYKWYLL